MLSVQDSKITSNKNLVIFSIPRTGSSFLGQVINSFKEFEFFGEVYHHSKVHIPYRRKLELIKYIFNEKGIDIKIEREKNGGDIDLVKFAHDFPGVLFESMRNTSKSNYLGFKIFQGHLKLDVIKQILINNKNIIKLVLKRNMLESYSSSRIAYQTNQYQNLNTNEIKIVFKNDDFTKWLNNKQKFYSFLEECARKLPQEYFFLDYQEINQYKSNYEKAIFLANFLRKIGFDISEEQNFSKFSFLKKQDSRANVLDKFENPSELENFLISNNLEYLLDNFQSNKNKDD